MSGTATGIRHLLCGASAERVGRHPGAGAYAGTGTIQPSLDCLESAAAAAAPASAAVLRRGALPRFLDTRPVCAGRSPGGRAAGPLAARTARPAVALARMARAALSTRLDHMQQRLHAGWARTLVSGRAEHTL